MRLQQYIFLFGGGPGSGCHGPNCGRKSETGVGFVSPNKRTDVGLRDAQKFMNTPRHLKFAQYAKKLVGPKGSVSNAVGKWKDGQENSLVMHIKGTPEEVKDTVSHFGLQAEQKGVIAFSADRRGPDTMYTVHVPGHDIEGVANALQANGIEYSTLEPTAKQIQAHVWDQGNLLRGNISKAAESLGAHAYSMAGTGSYIGGETRSQGRKAYIKQLIR